MDLKSNEPYWLIKNGIINSYPSLRIDESCDVLIVGGGITGALIAHQCVKDGFNTIIIDKREMVNGSSSSTTSLLQYEIDTPLYKLIEMIGEEGALLSYRACLKAIDQLEEIASEIKSNAGFKRKSSLFYAAKERDVNWLKKEYEARKKAGFNVQWLSEAAIVREFEIQGAFGGILSKDGASIDAFKFSHEVLEFNKNNGLRVFDKTELIDVIEKNEINLCQLNTGSNIKTNKIIYCTGYESANLIKEKFVDLISTYAIISEVEKDAYEKYNDILIWDTSDPYLYMRTTADNRFLIGGEDENFRDPKKRDKLLEQKSKKLRKSFMKIFPNKDFIIDFQWAGTFGKTSDGLPYIGEHPDFKNTYFVLGFGGNGITFSVAGMDMLSRWLRGEKHPLANFFKFGR